MKEIFHLSWLDELSCLSASTEKFYIWFLKRNLFFSQMDQIQQNQNFLYSVELFKKSVKIFLKNRFAKVKIEFGSKF